MSEFATCTIDTTGLHNRINELYDALIGAGAPGDAATIFEDESRRLLESIVRITPPRSREQGEEAIKRDLFKIFTPINDDFMNDVGAAHGVANVDAWVTDKKYQRPVHLRWDRIDPTGAGMQDFHHHNQNTRGHTHNLKKVKDASVWYSPYIVSFQDFTPYLARMKSHVGRRKAAWAKSLVALGGHVPRWIARHISGARGAILRMGDRNHPSITISNFAPGILNDERIVRDAIRIRTEAMGRRLRLLASGYSQDVARGLRIARKAHKTAALPVE